LFLGKEKLIMKKSIFTLTIFVSLLLLSSIVSAQSRLIPLDTISNFFNQILKIFGVTTTTVNQEKIESAPTTITKEKTIPSSGSIVYSTMKSYIVFIEGSLIKAKNGNTEEIEFQDTDASNVINWALNHLTLGRAWKEKVILVGAFPIKNTALRIPSYTILNMTNARLFLGDSGNIDIRLIENYDLVNGNSNIDINGGEIDGSNALHQIQKFCIYFNNVSNFLINGSYVHDCGWHGIRVANSTDGLIENCTSNSNFYSPTNWGMDGISIGQLSKRITIRNCTFRNNGAGVEIKGLPGLLPDDIKVEKCYIFQPGSEGGILLGTEGGNTPAPTYCCRNVIIRNNIIESSGYYGIDIAYANDTLVVGNVISNSSGYHNWPKYQSPVKGSGIHIFQSRNTTIYGNIIKNNTQYGIAFRTGRSVDNLIKNNQIFDNGLDGIYVESGDYNNITKNTIIHNKRYGVNLTSDANNNNVSFNTLCDNLVGPVYDGDSNLISNNIYTCDCNSECKTLKGTSYSGTCKGAPPQQGVTNPTGLDLGDASFPETANGETYNAYHKHSVLVGMFMNLCGNHPGYCSYESIGKTYQGHDIVIFRIGNPHGGIVMWDGCLHGWEDGGSEIMYNITQWLLEGTSERDLANRILENNYVLFIPVINMDSYLRCNKNNTLNPTGVDLNRNFKVDFHKITAPSNCEEINPGWHGSSYWSENESKAMLNAFKKYRPDYYLNTHLGAGPYLSYYSGNDGTKVSLLKQTMREISQERGAKCYPGTDGTSEARNGNWDCVSYPPNSVWGNGLIVNDAHEESGGHTEAWLLEINNEGTAHREYTLQQIQTTWYKNVLPIFLTMTDVSEIPLSNQCLSTEDNIGRDSCNAGYRCCCS
jgi:parallel beta-helix repeat protein